MQSHQDYDQVTMETRTLGQQKAFHRAAVDRSDPLCVDGEIPHSVVTSPDYGYSGGVIFLKGQWLCL